MGREDMSLQGPIWEPPAILPQKVAAIIDQQVPAVLKYLDSGRMREVHLMGPTVLLSQYADSHSRYCGDEELRARAWAEIERVLAAEQPQYNAYDTAFQVWALFDCYRTAEPVLEAQQLARLRALFRPLGGLLLACPWNFEADSRINVALLQAAGLGVAGWALDDDGMRRASHQRAEQILNEHCDENGIPSEVSLSYSVQMIRWAAQACETEDHPALRCIIRGLAGLLPLFIYEPTLELIGPDCREVWKSVWRYSMDQWVVGLKIAAGLLSDGTSEWLARLLFQKWENEEESVRASYTPRGPQELGCARYGYGWPSNIGTVHHASGTAEALCTLKRWLGAETPPREPVKREGYRSSRLYLHRDRKGDDVAAMGNLVAPLSYFTPDFALHGCELWTDDSFFWHDDTSFLPTVFSEHGFSFVQAPYSAAERREKKPPLSDRIVRAVLRYEDQLLYVVRISCTQELEPGITSWAGLLLTEEREGEVVFGRDGEIGRGRVCDELADCDWLLYPCGVERRFGFGLLALSSTGLSHRLSNFSGDWCVLGLSQSSEVIRGLEAMAVISIGPWTAPPEAYVTWLTKWKVEFTQGGCLLMAPDGAMLKVPFPPLLAPPEQDSPKRPEV